MKIIQSFSLITVGLFATTLSLAQEIKTEVLKPAEIKTPPAAGNKPSPVPELKSQAGITPKQASVAVLETPSPLKKNENNKLVEESKTEILVRDPKVATNKLSAENLKTLNGTTERPKQLIATPASDTLNAMLQPVSKPVIAKTPANQ